MYKPGWNMRTNERTAHAASMTYVEAPALAIVVEEFLADLRLDGRAVWTLKKHGIELRQLDEWLTDQAIAWQQVSHQQIRAYARRKADRGFSARSNMLCSLRVFFAWAVSQDYLPLSPAIGLKTPQRPMPVPKALKREQVRAIIDHLDAARSLRDQRDRALILTAIYAGFRAQELANLRWETVDLDERAVAITISKMNHGRVVSIHPALCAVLRSWRETQAAETLTDYCFSLGPTPLLTNSVGKITRRMVKRLGFHFSPHILRHTFATWTLRRSGNLYAVSKALGHRKLEQTEIYVSADVEDLRKAMDMLPDIGDW